jgi:chitinase
MSARDSNARILSWPKVGALVGVLAVAGGATYFATRSSADSADPGPTRFAPYVDATLTPTYPFGSTVDNPATKVVLGFVVAKHGEECTPTWGSAYTLDEAASTIDVDRRLLVLRQHGADAIVSFGGQANSELSVACTDPAALQQAYLDVIDRYQLTTIDLDLEGAALTDTEAAQRRAVALKAIQDDQHTAIWLTLPVSPDGLTPAGTAAVDTLLANGVEVAGVNAMVMDFGDSRGARSMEEAVEDALKATHRQVQDAFKKAGITLTPGEAWGRVGATPMIGQNDTARDVFSLEDAQALVKFARKVGLGRISMWSINRDVACGSNVDTAVAQNYCSGVDTQQLAYTNIFLRAEAGGATATDTTVTGADSGTTTTTVFVKDDASHSPYPIWNEGKGYKINSKVVWHGQVYIAKWWTQGDWPDARVENEWNTPWQLVGPVMPTDTVQTTTTIARGSVPEWNSTAEYVKGDVVWWRGVVYTAKWWTSGDEPGIDVPNSWDTPWALGDQS